MPVTHTAKEEFYRVLTEAVNEVAERGFTSQHQLDDWLVRLNRAARAALVSESVLEQALRSALVTVYNRAMVGPAMLRRHKGLDQFTLASIKPKLRAELDRRIAASAQLIRLNRDASIQRTLQRFAGWVSSVPPGGSQALKKREARMRVRRGIAALPFEERRVIVDQGHKLASAIDDIVARDGGAIAGVWHSRWREAGYDYREDHKERDERVYVVRNNWALRRGLMKHSGSQYTDQLTQPGEEINCRCRYEYLYTLRDLPVTMLTLKGVEELRDARRTMRQWDRVHDQVHAR